MYLDMGNMMSYNKGHGCEQPYVTCTLIPSPFEKNFATSRCADDAKSQFIC